MLKQKFFWSSVWIFYLLCSRVIDFGCCGIDFYVFSLWFCFVDCCVCRGVELEGGKWEGREEVGGNEEEFLVGGDFVCVCLCLCYEGKFVGDVCFFLIKCRQTFQ